MRRIVVIGLITAFVGALWMVGQPLSAQTEGQMPGQGQVPAEPVEVDTEAVSYALGVDVARNLASNFEQQGMEISNERLAAGFEAGLSGEGVEMTDEQIAEAIQTLRMAMMQQQQQQARAEADENLAEGEAFLEENAEAEGVETTESGLQYKIIEQGEGEPPQRGDEVTVNYHGTLIDGTVFDSSIDPPQPNRPAEPATFQLGNVIEGWNEGLTHIGEGGKIMLYIPPDLAYGPGGAGQVIGPNATLVFEVELLEVDRADDGADE